MKESSRLLLIIGVIVSIGILAGCSVIGGSRNENTYINPNAKYFTGTRGIEATFAEMPTTLYYAGDEDANEFSIGVDVHNRGASYSRGGVYLSGFDPNLLVFKEIPINRNAVGACGISIGSIGFGQIGGIFRCDGVEVSSGAGVTNVRIDSINKLVAGIAERNNKASWWDPKKFDSSIEFTHNPTGNNFLMNFNRGQIEYFQHGRLFIAFLAGINFMQNGGREFLLAGNTVDFPGGESAYFSYSGRVVDWPAGLDQTRQTFMLTTCYQYTTFADPIICVDPDPISDHRKVCRPQSRTWSGGNGAPVAVTSVEQENTPKKIIFRINVKNVGGGTVYDAGQLEKCSPYSPQRATPADLNIVYLGDVRIGQVGLRTSGGPGGMTCYPEQIRLDPNTKTGSTTCTYPIEYTNIKSAYQTPLVIELWYGYSQTQQRALTIKRVG